MKNGIRMKDKRISGFSKLSKMGKIHWVTQQFFEKPDEAKEDLVSFWLSDESQQQVLDGFSENTISNYYLPYGVAPNFLINGKVYTVPMVIEESSVVAAASSAAKFWLQRGGFHAEVLSTQKVGQVHFSWAGEVKKLRAVFGELIETFQASAQHITANMEKRGGGVTNVELIDFTAQEPNYYQLKVHFETCDSMGANFINSVLENYAECLKGFMAHHNVFEGKEKEVDIIMSILSNYTPDCLVRAWVEAPVEQLEEACKTMSGEVFAQKFYQAIRIAHLDVSRATTHNKGIFNGVDAVVLATANDFRAIEAGGHTYAARDGQYKSLSNCTIENGHFKFWLDLPLAVGTIGGLTRLHPVAKRSLELLGNPSAKELMMVIAATGLAQNFAAVRSLITTGIQKGHMKMHLGNVLNHLQATAQEKEAALSYFEDKLVSFTAVRAFLDHKRNGTLNGHAR